LGIYDLNTSFANISILFVLDVINKKGPC